MKRILFVLGLVLLSSLLFAQTGPDPLGNQAQYTNIYQHLNYWQWARQVQESPESPHQFMEQVRLGNQVDDSAQPAAQKEQRQERSGDCSGDCDGEPVQDQLRDQTQDQLRDGSCEDSADDPDQDRIRSGRA